MCSSSPYIFSKSTEILRFHYQYASIANMSIIADCLPQTSLLSISLLFASRFQLNPIPLPHLLLVLPSVGHRKCYVSSLRSFPSFLRFVFGCYYFNSVVSLCPLHAYSLTPCSSSIYAFGIPIHPTAVSHILCQSENVYNIIITD